VSVILFFLLNGGLGLLVLNGKIYYLNYKEDENYENQDNIKDIYIGNLVKTTLVLKKIKDYDEGAFYKGIMIVEYMNNIDTFKIKGQSGC
jgi:hypothetical protein